MEVFEYFEEDQKLDPEDKKAIAKRIPATLNEESFQQWQTLPDIDLKRRIAISHLWTNFTNDAFPARRREAVCKQCLSVQGENSIAPLLYIGKSSKVATHLSKYCKGVKELRISSSNTPYWLRMVDFLAKDNRDRRTMADRRRRDALLSAAMSIPRGVPDASSTSRVAPSLVGAGISTPRSASPPVSERSLHIENFRARLATWFYKNNLSFDSIDDTLFWSAIDQLDAHTQLKMERKDLAETYLDRAYKEAKEACSHICANKQMALTMDGWSTETREHRLNFAAVSPQFSAFLSTTAEYHQSKEGNDPASIANNIEEVLRKHSEISFVGIVTDNNDTNRAARRILQQKMPHLFTVGCFSHTLSLLAKDIIMNRELGKNRIGSGFEDLSSFVGDCFTVINFILDSPRRHADFRVKLKEHGLARDLIQQCSTRWASAYSCLEILRQVEPALCEIIASLDMSVGSRTARNSKRQCHQTLFGDETVSGPPTGYCKDFKVNLELILNLLKPIDSFVLKYQSNKIPLSEVIPDFKKLSSEYSRLLDNDATNGEGSKISVAQLHWIQSAVEYRMGSVVTDAHRFATALDPRFLDLTELAGVDIKEVYQRLSQVPVQPDEAGKFMEYTGSESHRIQDRVNEEIASFRLETLERFKDVSEKKQVDIYATQTPLLFWSNAESTYPALFTIAKRLFAMTASVASSELKFCRYSSIRTGNKNDLTPDRVDKLTYLAYNLSLCENKVAEMHNTNFSNLGALSAFPESAVFIDNDQPSSHRIWQEFRRLEESSEGYVPFGEDDDHD